MRFVAPVLRPFVMALAGLLVLVPSGKSSRLFYKRGRPTRTGRAVNRFWSWLVSSGLTTERWPGTPVIGPLTLETKGRKSGEPCSNMVTWVEHNGNRYLVSMLGERSDWVRNSRADGGKAFARYGKRRPVRLEEVPLPERAPIIQAWFGRTYGSTEHHLGVKRSDPIEEFERIAPAHPVFQIVESNPQPPASSH